MSTPVQKKKAPKHPDVAFQKVLLILQLVLFISVYGIIFALLMMMFIGAYQVLSTLYFAFIKHSTWHKQYLIHILIYGAITSLTTMAMYKWGSSLLEGLVFVLLIIVPYGLSIHCYFGNKNYHAKHSLSPTEKVCPMHNDDILDDFMMDQKSGEVV